MPELRVPQTGARAFRDLKDWSGNWSLIDAKISPPRALIGLFNVALVKIETALLAPLPTPKPRKRRAKPAIGANHPGAGQGSDGAPNTVSLFDALKSKEQVS